MIHCHYCLSLIKNEQLGRDKDNNAVCYSCCAWLDCIELMNGNPVALYESQGSITNWPGSLSLHVTGKRTGKHNMTGTRTTYYFVGPCGSSWSGVEYHGVCSGNLLRQVRRLAS